MSDNDLRDAVRRVWPRTPARTTGDFASAWRSAEARHAAQSTLWPRAAGVAAALVLAGVALVVFDQDRTTVGPPVIDAAELLGSTSWSAPSDVLLPEHRFDIYQELPELLESTPPAGGSLL